jgi:chemotaxis protein CheX
MRYEYVQPFVASAQEILGEVLSGSVEMGRIQLSPAPVPCRGVTAIVGVTGEGGGRVLFDMSRDTALRIAGEMNDEEQATLTTLAQDTLSELASMMTGRAISVLNDMGHRLGVSPPTLVAGDNVVISNSDLETMVVPLSTSHGEVVVNVAMATV